MKKLLLLLISLAAGIVQAQYVTTVNQFPEPRVTDAIISDQHHNLFISDFNGTAVYKRDRSGTLSVFATGFDSPNGLALDSQENLFVVDFGGSAIFKVSSSGTVIDTFMVATPSGIIKMYDSDTMIFTQYYGNKIMKLAPNGVVVPMHSGGILNGPVGLAYDSTGQLFGANFNNREIYKINTDTVLHWATLPLIGSPSVQRLGFIAYARGSIWATAFTAHQLFRVELSQADSVEWFSGSSAGITDGHVSIAKFNRPNGICSNPAGDTLYVTDAGNGRVRMITDTPVATEIPLNSFTLELGPNPATNEIRLRFDAVFEEGQLKVVDQSGKTCISIGNLGRETQILDIHNLTTGVYVVRIEKGEIAAQEKFVKY